LTTISPASRPTNTPHHIIIVAIVIVDVAVIAVEIPRVVAIVRIDRRGPLNAVAFFSTSLGMVPFLCLLASQTKEQNPDS
jgi:hypothetical protein